MAMSVCVLLNSFIFLFMGTIWQSDNIPKNAEGNVCIGDFSLAKSFLWKETSLTFSLDYTQGPGIGNLVADEL